MSTEYILCCLIGYVVNFLSQLSAKRVNDKDDKDDKGDNCINNRDDKGDNCINNKDEKDEHGDSDVDSGVGVDWCY